MCNKLGMELPSLVSEFEKSQLGDARLTKRLCRLVQDFEQCPDGSIPEVTGDWGQACGAYRFFDNPGVKPSEILAPHTAATVERARGERLVLALADSTSFNYGDQR